MHNLTLTQEFNDFIHVSIIGQAEYVIIYRACLLLCCQILVKVCQRVARRCNRRRRKRRALRALREHRRAVIGIILRSARSEPILAHRPLGQLINQSADHLKVSQLLGTYIGQKPLCHIIGHNVTLRQIPQARTKLPVRSAEVQKLKTILSEYTCLKQPIILYDIRLNLKGGAAHRNSRAVVGISRIIQSQQNSVFSFLYRCD